MNQEKIIQIGNSVFKIASNCCFDVKDIECVVRENCKSRFMTLGDYKCPLGIIRNMIKMYIEKN